MVMTLKENIQWLLDKKYIVIVNNRIICTQRLNRELFNINEGPMEAQVIATPEVVLVRTPVIESDLLIDKKAVWNQFIERACIPHRVKATDGGEYTVRQYSPSAINKLIQIIKTPGIEYDKLVDSTKHYYTTVAYKALLSNYLLKDIWKDEYQSYRKNMKNTTDGSSLFED